MKLCLIGSSRFKDLYDKVNRELTLLGHVCYSIAMISTGEAVTEEEKIVLDLVHLRKIQESDGVILITDETNYIGFSTRREMIWAQMIDKPVYFSTGKYPTSFEEPEKLIRRFVDWQKRKTSPRLGDSE